MAEYFDAPATSLARRFELKICVIREIRVENEFYFFSLFDVTPAAHDSGFRVPDISSLACLGPPASPELAMKDVPHYDSGEAFELREPGVYIATFSGRNL